MQILEVPLTSWEQCINVYSQTGALDSPKSIGIVCLTFTKFLLLYDFETFELKLKSTKLFSLLETVYILKL